MELDEDKSIPFEVHYKHHVWAERQMEYRKKREEWWSDMLKHIAKTTVIVVLGVIVTLIVLGGETKLKEVIKEVTVEQGVVK